MTNETTMKGILHALNSIASSLNPEYQPLNKRIYDNQQRAFIIQKAKDYITEKRREYNVAAIDSSIRFDIDHQNNCATCTIFNRHNKQLTHRGIHQLKHENEVTNHHIAAALALANALDETLPWADNIPQPNITKIGHRVEYQDCIKTIVSSVDFERSSKRKNDFMHCTIFSEHAEKGEIVNDTDAIYDSLRIGESDI